MKSILLIILVILSFLQYKLWFANDGVPEVLHLQKQFNNQVTFNNKLRMRNSQLDAEVNDLKHGSQAVEERARNELGMVKNDEEFFQFVSPRQGAQTIDQAPKSRG